MGKCSGDRSRFSRLPLSMHFGPVPEFRKSRPRKFVFSFSLIAPVCLRRGCGPVRLRGSRAGRVDVEKRRPDHRRQTHAGRLDGRAQGRQERNVPRQLCQSECPSRQRKSKTILKLTFDDCLSRYRLFTILPASFWEKVSYSSSRTVPPTYHRRNYKKNSGYLS